MDPHIDLSVGTIVEDTYEVLGVLGQGGMGRVYRVRHLGWNVDLALKAPRPDLAADAELLRIFVQEAETWVGLGAHPHIVQCHYVRNLRGLPYVFAERVEGGSLAGAIEQRTLYAGTESEVLARVIDIALQCAWGLALAHGANVVHQDVKPANILLTTDHIAKVCDFGLARAKPGGRAGDEKHTFAGMTPAYASPEQRRAARTGERSGALTNKTDVWSWAVSVLHMLAGEVTWLAGSVAREAALAYAASGGFPAVARTPTDLVELLLSCLRDDPDERPRADAIAESLLALRESALGEPYPHERPEPGSFLTGGLNNRGLSLLDLGKSWDALTALDEAVARDPRHAIAVYNRGLVAWRAGKATDRDVLGAIQDAAQWEAKEFARSLHAGWVHLERGAAYEAWVDGRRAEGLATTPEEQEEAARYAVAFREVIRADDRRPVVPPFAAHERGLRAAAFTRDGRLALTGDGDGAIRLWSLAEGRLVTQILRKGPSIRALALSADGTRACASDGDGHVWSIDVATEKWKRLCEGSYDTLAITADGSTLLAANQNRLHVWDLGSSRRTREIEPGTERLTLSVDGAHVGWPLAGQLHLWDFKAEPGSIPGHVDDPQYKAYVDPFRVQRRPMRDVWDAAYIMESTRVGRRALANAVVPIRGGTALVSCGNDETVRVWSFATRKVETYMSGVRTAYERLAVDDDETLLFGAAGELLSVWELATGRLLRTERMGANIVALAACARGRRIAIATADGTLRLLAHSPSRAAPLVLCHPRAALVDPDVPRRQRSVQARVEAALRDDRAAEAVRAFHELLALPGQELSEPTLALERRLSAVAERSGLRAVVAGGVEALPKENADATVAISADGERVGWCSGRSARLIGRGRSRELCLDEGVFFAFAMAPDGLRVAAAAYGKLVTWPAMGFSDWMLEMAAKPTPFADALPRRESPAGVRPWPKGPIGGYSPLHWRSFELEPKVLPVYLDGRIHAIALGREMELVAVTDAELRIFDLATGHERLHVRWGARCVAVTPDGRHVATGNADGGVEIWARDSGKRLLREKKAHAGAVAAIAMSAGGGVLISAGADGVVQRLRGDGDRAVFAERHAAPARGVAVTPDGGIAVSCGEDAVVRVYDVRSGQCLRVLAGGARKLTSVAISADAHVVVAANDAGEIRRWRLHWHLVPPGHAA
jgi:serine/threonine protein kinase/WD40 repeat protein